jgi:dCTP deaminase
MKYGGALPSQTIRQMTEGGFIKDTNPNNIRPGSLDLSLSSEGYRALGVFRPSFGETVHHALNNGIKASKLGCDSILERGNTYVFLLQESINSLPEDIYMYCNPKSSSGRIDVHVRLMVDGISRYDYVPKGYSGPLWLMVTPKTFPIIVKEGVSLNQARFFNQDTRFDELRLELNFNQDGGLIFNQSGEVVNYKDIKHTDRDGSVLLTLGLDFSVVGFEAIETKIPLDLSLKNHYDPECFFREVIPRNNALVLSSNSFYILSTKESVRVPAKLACEMRPMDERSGDLRSHYAGFIDPGWGVGVDNLSKGRPLTLEVRSFDSGIIIQHGQPIAKVRYEKMVDIPESHYDQMNPTYGVQNGPKLGKYFKEWK